MPPLTIFLTTWNTGLQGSKAQSQDLTSWLLPVLHQAHGQGQAQDKQIPDLYAIAVQELLPVHLALAGLTSPVLSALTSRIQSLLSSHASSLSDSNDAERYILVSRSAHVGNALWVFARESTMRGRLGKAQEASLGVWYGGMGNKGAVGVRLPVRRGGEKDEGGWEVLTFVCAHLEAHPQNISRRNEQYQQILTSLLFPPTPLTPPRQISDTSHLFVMGDLNYRLSSLPASGWPREGGVKDDVMQLEEERMEMVRLDTLRGEMREGRVFGGLREGDLSRFVPTYKRVVGSVEGYSKKRTPGYTDRILFSSHTDPPHLVSPQTLLTPTPPNAPETTTQILHYLSTPSITLSDHKPVQALLLLPPPSHSARSANLAPTLSPPPSPHPHRPTAESWEVVRVRKIVGTLIDRLVGWPWCLVVFLGFGDARAGMGVSGFVAMIWGIWWSGVWAR